jgi:amino acid transporter
LNTSEQSPPALDAHPPLKLRDTLSLILGIVIGSAIYVFPASVAFNAETIPRLLGVWLFAGMLSTIGAMCYAELASADPRSGGDFNYISQAYGRRFGIVYGWMQLSVIIPGNIAVMSFVFAEHASRPVAAIRSALDSSTGSGAPQVPMFVLSLVAVFFLASLNLAGTVTSKYAQNILTALKVVGLSLILVAGLVAAAPPSNTAADAPKVEAAADSDAAHTAEAPPKPNLALALIFAMFAYGGWSEAAYVASEVQDARRNVPRALVIGMGSITVIYLLINLAYVHGLGLEGLKNPRTSPASDLIVHGFGAKAGVWMVMDVLVAISALGAMQGMIFAGSRLVSVVGQGHSRLYVLSRQNSRRSPFWAIITLTGLASMAIVAFATDVLRDAVRKGMEWVTRKDLTWDAPESALDALVAAMAPVVWFYFASAGLSLIVLRLRQGARRAPVPVPGYPITPLIFCATCLWMGFSAIRFAGTMTLLGLVPMLIGLPFVLGPGTGTRGQE